jgi:16S rRNA (cytidine1402-2'-O)-methyltransferase
MLKDIGSLLGDRSICVARELTKIHEEIWRGPVSGAIDHFSGEVLGEIVLVVAGAGEPEMWDVDQVRSALQDELESGTSATEAAKKVAGLSGWNRREVYALIEKT